MFGRRRGGRVDLRQQRLTDLVPELRDQVQVNNTLNHIVLGRTAPAPSEPRLRQTTLHDHPVTAGPSRVLRELNSRRGRLTSVQDRTRQTALDFSGHKRKGAATKVLHAKVGRREYHTSEETRSRHIVIAGSQVRQMASNAMEVVPAAGGGASGSGGGGGGSTSAMITGEPIWQSITPKQYTYSMRRKTTWYMNSAPQPSFAWFSDSDPGPRFNRCQLQWHLIPTQWASMFLDSEASDIINPGTAWRIDDAKCWIEDAKVFSYRYNDPSSTTPSYQLSGNSVVDLECLQVPTKMPGVFNISAFDLTTGNASVGWQLDGTFTNGALPAGGLQSTWGNAQAMRRVINEAETGIYQKLPSVQFAMPSVTSNAVNNQGFLGMTRSIAGTNTDPAIENSVEGYAFNRFTDVYRTGQGPVDIGVKWIKGWRQLPGVKYFGGHYPANTTTFPEFSGGVASAGVRAANLPVSDGLKPMPLVTNTANYLSPAVAPVLDFMGNDPKEHRWGYRSPRDQVINHKSQEAHHTFIRVRPIPRGVGEEAVYHKVLLDIETEITVTVLVDDNFPLAPGPDVTGNYSVLERCNNLAYSPYSETVYSINNADL